jgi:hypothetical protein
MEEPLASAAVVGPFILLAVIIFTAIWWYVREGRNSALENLVMLTDSGTVESFRGTLAVQEHKPGRFLRLGQSTTASRRLQFWYRWVVGKGRQAVFDNVTFDGDRGLVELKNNSKDITALFSEFSTVRMREVAGGHGYALWHVELIPHKGKPIPFVTSAMGGRRAMFEQTAPVAKAVSAITTIPVQVFVAGNIWTPGWPPKNRVVSS